jgi:hypothetical protein
MASARDKGFYEAFDGSILRPNGSEISGFYGRLRNNGGTVTDSPKS